MKLKLLTLLLTMGLFAFGTHVNAVEKSKPAAEGEVGEKMSFPSMTDVFNAIVAKLDSGSAASMCAKGSAFSPFTFRSFDGALCCKKFFIGGTMPGCENTAALAQAVCGGVGDFDGSTCGQAMPKDIKSNPAAKLKDLISKDPTGLLAKAVCDPKAKLPAGGVLDKLVKSGICKKTREALGLSD